MGDLRKTPLGKLLLLQTLIGGGSPAVERIALGNPLTFGTDLARPIVSLEIPFTPKQTGSGDPSPENIRSILPWNGLTVFGGGKNLFDKNATPYQEGKYINDNSVVGGQLRYTENQNYNVYKIPVAKNAKYVIGLVKATQPGIALVDGRGTVTYFATNQGGTEGTYKYISTGSKDAFLLVSVAVSGTYKCDDVLQIEVGQTATAYEPYHPITETDIVFSSPVYGGTLDVVSGVMNVPVAFAEFDGSDDESWNVGAIDANKSRAFIALTGAPKTGYNREIIGNYIKPTASAQSSPDLWTANINASGNILIGIDPSITTVEAWKAYLAEHPLQIVYPLATPQEIQLTPAQITAIVGDNTIWSDADGSLTAVYLVSSKYADEHPVGGLGFGFGSGSDPDEPEDPENHDEQEEPVVDDSETAE